MADLDRVIDNHAFSVLIRYNKSLSEMVTR